MTATPPATTIATWNVNGIRARHAQVLELVERLRPDGICLHVPNGGKDFPAKMTFLDAMTRWAADLHARARRVVLCGDVNNADRRLRGQRREGKRAAGRMWRFMLTVPASVRRQHVERGPSPEHDGPRVLERLAGTGLGFNNNFAPVSLAPDGTAYVRTLGGSRPDPQRRRLAKLGSPGSGGDPVDGGGLSP